MDSSAAPFAMEGFYQDHRGWLLRWLRARLHCSSTAEDLVQDTFVRLLLAPAALTTMRHPRAFLATTARRLLIDRSRRLAVEQTYLEALAATVGEGAQAPSAEQCAQTLEALALLAQALDELPARARMAFLSCYLDGETQAVVAQRLGVSERTVRNDLVQALLHIQALVPA
ncbi:MAG TPA: RNA polymerase subunit sigma [Alcaligenes faecalis]|nr:RNA polymerase subunit sigma [Alcaligenes faecalis]